MNTTTSLNTSVLDERKQAARQERALWISVVIDLIAFVPYVLVAIFSGSMLLLSDIAEFFRNFVVNGVSLRILRKIRRGEVHEFDYGSGKLERAGSLFGALCYVGALTGVMVFSIHRLLNPAPLDTGFTIAGMLILLVVIAVSGVLWIYYKRVANETPGPLIDVQWRHQRDDTLSSIVVLVALGFAVLFREKPWALYLDPAFGLAYAVFAIGSYVPVFRESLKDLLDHTLAEDVQLIITRRLAGHFDRYEAFHGVRSRRAGNRLFIEVALGFDPAKTVGEVSDTMESLRAAIEGDIPSAEVSIVIKPLQNHAAKQTGPERS